LLAHATFVRLEYADQVPPSWGGSERVGTAARCSDLLVVESEQELERATQGRRARGRVIILAVALPSQNPGHTESMEIQPRI